MIFKKKYILGLAIITGLTFIGLDSFANSQSNLDDIANNENVYEIKENENGQTYGSDLIL